MSASAQHIHHHDREALVQTIQLTKRYGNNRGIQDINLLLYPGEVFGFLGPNGAGKTTTIRCILDLLRPTSGASYLFGTKVEGRSAYLRAKVGYVAGEVRLIEGYTGQQLIRLNEGLRKEKALYAKELAQRFEIDLKRKARTLSKGNKQKLALLLAFMFDNKLFILDEPTSGLDPLNQQLVFQLIKERCEKGATVLLSSHVLSEVEQSCSRVGVVSAGHLLAQESMEGLIDKQLRHVKVKFAADQSIDPITWKAQTSLKNPTWDGQQFFTASIKPCYLDQLVKELARYSIDDIEIQKASLEEIFMDMYEIDQTKEYIADQQESSRSERGIA